MHLDAQYAQENILMNRYALIILTVQISEWKCCGLLKILSLILLVRLSIDFSLDIHKLFHSYENVWHYKVSSQLSGLFTMLWHYVNVFVHNFNSFM